MKPAFHIGTTRKGSTLALVPAGDLDLDSCPAFDQVEQMADQGTTVVACSMERVPFMDLNGLHCLLALAHRLETRGTRLIVYAWQPQPRRLLGLVDDLSDLPDAKVRERLAAAAALRSVLDHRAHEGHDHGVRTPDSGSVRSGAIAGLSRRPGAFRSSAA
ncbi:STAS domain-containing protein [Streptomyces sp. NPDC006450]|uniref:STAS domain-containing protein n=1 Tax=Streptomyces sp. NPDC006450 TaxID=3155458 RepID=UPI0033A1B631